MPPAWKGPLHVNLAFAQERFGTEQLDAMPDGTSNTVLVGERYNRDIPDEPNVPRRTTFWAYSYGSYNTSSTQTEPRTLTAFEYITCIYPNGRGGIRLNDNPCKRGWGSAHSGAVNFVFCDGSVRALSTNIDMTIFFALGTVAGGEVIPNF
jgi:prepilin-type processing-associated H-X9-DG protein